MTFLLAVTLAVTLTGCGLLGSLDYAQLTQEQIMQAVKDKSFTSACTVVNSPWGKGINSMLNLDNKVLPANSVIKIDDACKVEITTGAAK